ARKRGIVKFGRPKANIPDNWYEILLRVHSGEIKSTEAMKILNLKKSTYYKLRKLYPLRFK
ncbi:MAG: recombinase family protein, partial [Ruminococcus sp.]